MVISRRRLRFRFRFGFGLAAVLTALALLAPVAYGAPGKAKPKPVAPLKTSAADQYKTTTVTYVSLTAAKVGKCKLAVTKRYAPKKKACKGKKACSIVAKAELTAKKKCNKLAQSATAKAKAKAKPKAKTTKG